MTSAISVNGIRAVSVTLLIPWRGPWIADVDLDPDTISTAPTSGPATLTIGVAPSPVTTLQGTIDPRYSGTFIASARVRIVAGAGGWDKPLGPRNWDSPSGSVSSAEVYSQTAALVGETVQVASPQIFGAHFERIAGPASVVFGDSDYFVDFAGVTQVASRAAATADPTLELLEWHPDEQRAELSCDAVVLPGTTLSDPRLNGATPTIRDVEQRWDKSGVRASAWCSSAATSRLAATLKSLVRAYSGASYLKIYRYRYVQASGSDIALQAITPGAPDINPIAMGTGMAGVLAKLAPSTVLYIAFVAGDKTDPIIISYDSSKTPLEVDLAGGSDFVALAAKCDAEFTKIATAFATFVPGSGGANFPAIYQPSTPPVGPPAPSTQDSVAAARTKAT